MRRILPLALLGPLALAMAGCSTAPQTPVKVADSKDAQAFSTYLSARFAAGEHDLDEAARYYGQALNNDPGNPSLLALSFFYSTTLGDFENAGKYAQGVVAATPMGRWGRPEEIGELARYLCSEKTAFMNGSDILMDGGWVAQ